MTFVVGTFFFAIVSALLPLVNIEVYLAATANRLGVGEAVVVAVASAAGQTIGKLIWYLGGLKFTETRWLRHKLDRRNRRRILETWHARIEGRPFTSSAVMLLSAVVGIPPLLVLAILAGVVRMPLLIFVPTVLVGRSIRFWLILAGVDLMLG